MLTGAEDHVLVKGFSGSCRKERRDSLGGSGEEALSGLEGVGVGSRRKALRVVIETRENPRAGPCVAVYPSHFSFRIQTCSLSQ